MSRGGGVLIALATLLREVGASQAIEHAITEPFRFQFQRSRERSIRGIHLSLIEEKSSGIQMRFCRLRSQRS